MTKSIEANKFTISISVAFFFLFTTIGLAYQLGAKTMSTDDRVASVEEEQVECKAARIKQSELNADILRSLAVIEVTVRHIKEAVDGKEDKENK